MKLWDKGKSLNKLVEDYTVGNDYILDNELVKYDCLASIAHAKMLGKIELLTADETDKLVEELQQIITLHEAGEFEIKPEHEQARKWMARFEQNSMYEISTGKIDVLLQIVSLRFMQVIMNLLPRRK